ncbi:MAG: flagellar filament capping protein FliD [Candidatus Krumholzibacteriota bacterium]|nr:flagellar filament capping protein FliD [Candidatus Krumholzibacteriota bacterium]
MSLGLNSISGLISGIDSQSLVDQIIQVERRPVYLLEARKAQEQLRLASYEALQGAFEGLKNALDVLRRPQDYRTTVAMVSNAQILSVTADRDAPAGTYTLTVNQLAQSHQAVSQGYADPETELGTGTVKISLGGSEVLSVELTEGDNTLQALADAINEAGAEVTASVVNTGSGATPYQLILAGSETGADQLVTVSSDLTGGAGLAFGSVGAVVVGTQAGSSAVASGGHYTGNADATFSFDVTTGGTIGTDEIVIAWSNDQGDSGEIVLPADYAAGEAVGVFGGLVLDFGAGDLQAGDNWTVAAASGTIQAAQDALVSFGSSDGGATPVQVSSADNTLTDLIPGASVSLLKADGDEPVTITLRQDAAGVKSRITSFATAYNAVIGFFNQQMTYNADAGAAGLLMGDPIALRLDTSLRNALLTRIEGLDTEFSLLSQIGIGTASGGSFNADGTLSVDEDQLMDAIAEDLDSVVALLSITGRSSDADIVFLNAGNHVAPTGAAAGYEVRITQAATRGVATGASIAEPTAGSPLLVGESNRNFKVKINGVESATLTLATGSYESGADLAAAMQQLINNDEDLGGRGVIAQWVDDAGGQGHLVLTSKTWGGTSKVEIMDVDDSIYADLGLTVGSGIDGKDVEGHFLVDGEMETATGSGRILTGDQEGGATRSLSLEVRLTEASLAAQGESQGSVQVWSGVLDQLRRDVENYLDSADGIFARRAQGIQNGIDDYDQQIEAMDARLEKRRERYLAEFSRMETLLAEMNSTSRTLSSMLDSLPAYQISYGGSTGR